MCIDKTRSKYNPDGKKHYALNALKKFKDVTGELNKMELCNDY